MAEYTKGDWVIQSDGENICRLGARVAKAYDPEFPEKVTKITRANAHLMAAAPDMYEALKAIIERRMECHEIEAAYIPSEIQLAYKALAKAEGK